MHLRGKPLLVVLLSVVSMADLSVTFAQTATRRQPSMIDGSASASATITKTRNGFSASASASASTSSSTVNRRPVRRTAAEIARARAKKQRLNRFILSQVPELRDVEAVRNLQPGGQRRR